MPETITDIAAALRAGRVTSTALVERSLQRIRRLDDRFNSFVALDESGAAEAARQSDARLSQGAPRSALEGVPISIKDNIHVAGMPSTWGSRALAAFRPAIDELPVVRLRAAGAIVIGKTNVPEFTLEGYTRNDLFGVTRNPWNADLTPGGSTGGGAASVAAGLVPAAIGTDGGGSIRRPACHSGLVGFKPSIGRWPRIDGFPTILTDFETIGTLSRTVDDALLLDAVLKGPDPRDRRSLYTSAARWPNMRMRILHIARFDSAPVDPEVSAQISILARRLTDEGHEVRGSLRCSSISMTSRESGTSFPGLASPGSCARILHTKSRPAPLRAPWPPTAVSSQARTTSTRLSAYPRFAGSARNFSSALR